MDPMGYAAYHKVVNFSFKLQDAKLKGQLGKNGGPRLAVEPSLLEPFKRGLGSNEYSLNKVYMGVMIENTIIRRVQPFTL